MDSGSLRLPHFGDCTHDGQPLSHGHSLTSRWASSTSALERLEAAAGDADAAGVAVVDEDRRHAGLRVEVGREPADVPAVAHRQQRQHGDLRVLGGVQRAEQLAIGRPVASVGGSSYQSAWVANEVCGRSSADQVDRLVVGQALALVGEHLLGDHDGAEATASRRAPRGARARRSMHGVGLALGLRVPVAVERLHERAAVVEVERGRPRTCARRAGRPRPGGRCGTRAPKSTLPISSPEAVSTIAKPSRLARAQRRRPRPGSPRAGAGRTCRRGARRRSPAPTSALARSSRQRGPSVLRVGAARSGPSCAAHSRCAAWICSFSWSRIAASTGRSRNSSGWRQKNWSSASSPAT